MTNERDPDLEKLYREHSREEPPAALDAKILAAAHRAIESGPRKIGAEATRPQRWWMPLAAAAAIGVVAIGVIQQMPKETVIDATSVAPSSAPVPAAKPPPPAQESQSLSPPPSAPVPAAKPPPPAKESQAVPPPPSAPAPAATMEQKSLQMDTDSLAKKQKEAPAPALAPPPPPRASAPKPDNGKATVDAPERDSKLVAEPTPFPAAPAPQKTEAAASVEAKRDVPAESSVADARKDAFREERQAGAPATAGAAITSPPATTPAPAPAPSQPSANRMRAQSGAAGALAQSKIVDEEMQTLARDPDAWIVRIRKLRDEGNTAQALRELKEFRALVPDAERRLPPDLKSLQP